MNKSLCAPTLCKLTNSFDMLLHCNTCFFSLIHLVSRYSFHFLRFYFVVPSSDLYRQRLFMPFITLHTFLYYPHSLDFHTCINSIGCERKMLCVVQCVGGRQCNRRSANIDTAAASRWAECCHVCR